MIKQMAHHPIADLFPMLAEDELTELAADIAERGLLQPIVLDTEGRILDGRNRVAACELAGVEPQFTTYDGDDPDGYALAVNIARRHLTKGQQAMIIAAADNNYQPPADGEGVSRQYVAWARTVLKYADIHKNAVIAGAMPLKAAYDEALENKRKSEGVEAQLIRLRSEDPELADKVVEGELTLAGAWAERKARVAEEARQRRVATHLLCETVVAIAQLRDSEAATKYEPTEALPGRSVTREVIDNARIALDQMADVWKERDLT